MASIIEALESLAAKGWFKEWQSPALKQFILTGDERHLQKLPKFNEHSWLPEELVSALSVPSQLDTSGKRFLQACYAAGHPQALGTWLQQCAKRDSPAGAEFAKACAFALEIGCPQLSLATQVAQYVRPLRSPDGAATPAGRFLLALDDSLIKELVCSIGGHPYHAAEVAGLFVAHAPEQWKQLLALLEPDDPPKAFDRLKKFLVRSDQEDRPKHFDASIWTLGLAASPKDFLEPAAGALDWLKNWHSRFTLGSALYQTDPARFGPAMEKLTVTQLLAEDTVARRSLWQEAKQSAFWLVANRGAAAQAPLRDYFAAPIDSPSQAEYKIEVLDLAVPKLGRDALALLEACFATQQPALQLRALQLWAGVKAADDRDSVAGKLRRLCADKDPATVARAARLAGELFPEAVEPELWLLLSHKSRPVRDAAASSLGKLGNSRVPKAGELWGTGRTETRLAAVAWLRAVGTAAAADALKARLESEDAEDIRDAILLALEALQAGATAVSPSELRERIKDTLSKVKRPPAAWLSVETLPGCKLADGSKLPPDWLLYLLYRQSRVKEMRADIEAKPLYAQIDRGTSGDLALAVLQAFFGSEADADDRWTMAFAALLGDDRLVPVFTRQIKDWADNMRGKLAEYAVQALALLGTDAALLAVDAMAIRYRSKNKNIGKAAAEAFAEAARARGLTVEELGDLVVPWLGFQPGQPRVVDLGKAKLEARISNDFKLTFRDLATKKKVAKLPDSAPAEIKAEFKESAAGLKEAVKSQLLRMETLMVRQFRWPAARWEELYLQHPLLLPFSQRLVWGAYQANKLAGTFRALEDRSLTDAGDAAYTLPRECAVGILHPLELTPEARQAWLKHLADYDIIPPFAQLERPVVLVEPQHAQTKFGSEVAETELNAMTFKGRAERLGWTRGSVCDAGCINYYVKYFPTAGVDVFVETEGMYVGIDMYTNIKLGKIFFVKHGSVKIGSYIYDEPGDAKDPRLLSYGGVPVIAFSEAMGDLVKISGKAEAQPQEASHA